MYIAFPLVSLRGSVFCAFSVTSLAGGTSKAIAPLDATNPLTFFLFSRCTATHRLYPAHDRLVRRRQCRTYTIPHLEENKSDSPEIRPTIRNAVASSRSRCPLMGAGLRRLSAGLSTVAGTSARSDLELATNSDDADRMFSLGRALHLRRHRSPASRRLALGLFRESMRLRPEWKQTDSRFAMDSGIDDVLSAFACEDDVLDGGEGGSGMDPRTKTEMSVEEVRERANIAEAVEDLRKTLASLGYTARRVQDRFWPTTGPQRGQRLPGPYYLRKSFDHTHTATIASLGPLRDGLDAVIRLFLLGLAVPLAEVRRSLGPRAVESCRRLGIVGDCPVDSSLAVSLVQLFPLDAEALSSARSAESLPEDDRGGGASAIYDRVRGTEGDSVSNAVKVGGLEARKGEAEADALPFLGSRGVGAGGSDDFKGIVSPVDMVFATDWPPPGSTALTEEPVMYIGPDSIGLVQHAPRFVTPCSPTTGRDRDEYRETGSGGGRGTGRRKRTERILDLCCGSGVQGIAAAALRGGNARVTCVDINPRAVRFARFNAALNGLDSRRFRASVGDLYGAVERGPREDDGEDSVPLESASGGLRQTYFQGTDTSERKGAATDSGVASFRREEGRGCYNDPAEEDQGQGFPLPRAADDASSSTYDLILANPPFVPVPPRLGRAKRRYDEFASGGASGEEVVSRIFYGAIERLRPGGVLAVVTELANPRDFGAKLGRWIVAPPRPDVATAAAAYSLANDGHLRAIDKTSSSADGASGASAFRVSARAAPEGRAVPGASHGCEAIIFHEERLWSAAEYSAKRAGSEKEARGWAGHLDLVGIEEMAPGFIFVRRLCPGARGGNQLSAEVPPGFRCRTEGVQKLWAPYNRAALESTGRALREMQKL